MSQPPEVEASVSDDPVLVSDLRRAAANGELRLAYQPVLTLEDEDVVGVEALLRWQHPGLGLVSPGAFLPLAERAGLTADIGDWVLAEACRQATEWTGAGDAARPLTMSVNVAGHQLVHGHAALVASVRRALDRSGLAPENLTLEVTAGAVMVDMAAGERAVHELKGLGVRIALDNVRTGRSLESALTRLPVDLLKVDRSVVATLGSSPEDTDIVRGVIEMGHRLGIGTVAEGIETRGQLAALRFFGCAFGQGYLWSPGRPPADLGPSLFQATADKALRLIG